MKEVKVRMNDRPWMNSNLKRLIQKRKKAFVQGNKILYPQLRNKVNRMRKKCRKIFYETNCKVKELKQSKPKDWGGKLIVYVVFTQEPKIL